MIMLCVVGVVVDVFVCLFLTLSSNLC